MKIYFAGSIRGGREDVDIYLEIIKHLQQKGEVLTEHVGSAALNAMGENGITEEYIHDRDMSWLLSSDLIVAEVTNPSLGVGYELGRALENNKKVLCLYRSSPDKKLSAMIRGAKKFSVYDYNTIEEAKKIINEFLLNNSTT